FGVNMVALVNNRPRTLGLVELLQHFLDFRREVVRRRGAHDLRQAEDRAHILEGFAHALDNLDAVIALIRQSENPAAARAGLREQFELSERQAQTILELRLQRLTAMERQRILDELAEIRGRIEELKALLASEEMVMDMIVEELGELRTKYADPRRTELTPAVEELTAEDLIIDEDMVVTISHLGYTKRHAPALYRAQRRGGKGKIAATIREEDFVTRVFIASTHASLLCFTNRGRVHWLKIFELPELSRGARGKALVNLLHLGAGERVSAVLPVRSFGEGGYVVLATRLGTIKKTSLDAYSSPRRGGIIAINIHEGDELIGAVRTSGDAEILIATQGGKAIRFHESQARPMGRSAAGVRAIAARPGDAAVGMEVLQTGRTILTVTEQGYGKRTDLAEYREQNRGGQGIITIKTTARNGLVVGILQVADEDEVMLVTDAGKIIRTRVGGIPVMGRNTQGVRVMETAKGERVVSIARIAEVEDTPPGEAPEPAGTAESAAQA
ncbi:MAG: DNA gyrase C-terminal beta-propeller domain-containing protein, partial [Myxococcota bacterium]